MGGRDQQQGQGFPQHPAALPGEAVEGGRVEQHERWLSVIQVVGGGFPRPSDSHGFSRCLNTCGVQDECIIRHVCRRDPDRQNVGREKMPLLKSRLPDDMISYLSSRKPCRTPVDGEMGVIGAGIGMGIATPLHLTPCLPSRVGIWPGTGGTRRVRCGWPGGRRIPEPSG